MKVQSTLIAFSPTLAVCAVTLELDQDSITLYATSLAHESELYPDLAQQRALALVEARLRQGPVMDEPLPVGRSAIQKDVETRPVGVPSFSLQADFLPPAVPASGNPTPGPELDNADFPQPAVVRVSVDPIPGPAPDYPAPLYNDSGEPPASLPARNTGIETSLPSLDLTYEPPARGEPLPVTEPLSPLDPLPADDSALNDIPW